MTRSTDKTEKPQKFSATLSQEEINEDFRAMTGCRPPTRPKKGPKNVQRIVDRLIPGSRLNRVTRELYNVKGALDPCMIFRVPGFRHLAKLGTIPYSVILGFPAQARHLIPGFFFFFLFF
uniref:Uncharacterized protein n=1 Tax=Vitis vinifera TaxID=29760 RepID=A5B8Y9_VITVI|nr:hypothetical protein VITISV_014190 [Vitis vinifera]